MFEIVKKNEKSKKVNYNTDPMGAAKLCLKKIWLTQYRYNYLE